MPAALDRSEAESPRGRIAIAATLARGAAAATTPAGPVATPSLATRSAPARHGDGCGALEPRGDAAGAELALFPGCVASVEDAEAQRAALTLLRAAGYRIHVLPAFCCGAMDLHGDEAAAAGKAARRVRQAWHASGATRLLSVTPGCLGTLRHALPEVPVLDPWSPLAERADRLHFRPLPLRVALHLPCTQANVARSETAMLQVLSRVPQLEVASLPRSPGCCGAAGSHLLEFPERAAQLREAILRPLAALAPARLLSSNIGCRLHLAAGDNAAPWIAQHPLSLLAQQLEKTA